MARERVPAAAMLAQSISAWCLHTEHGDSAARRSIGLRLGAASRQMHVYLSTADLRCVLALCCSPQYLAIGGLLLIALCPALFAVSHKVQNGHRDASRSRLEFVILVWPVNDCLQHIVTHRGLQVLRGNMTNAGTLSICTSHQSSYDRLSDEAYGLDQALPLYPAGTVIQLTRCRCRGCRMARTTGVSRGQELGYLLGQRLLSSLQQKVACLLYKSSSTNLEGSRQ